MELLWIVIVLAAIMLIISDSKMNILKEEKHFLREQNILLRNDLAKMISVVENLAEDRKNNNDLSLRKRESWKRKNKNNKKIFIFNDGESEGTQRLRKLLKKNLITEVVLVDFKVLSSNLSSKDNIMIEESSLISKNLYNLPIIFYGGSQADFKDFLEHYGWWKRKDLEWVEYPFEEEDLKQVLKEMRKNKMSSDENTAENF